MSGSSDVQHEMLLLALQDELYTSPALPSTATVLDVGTGTGTWACQLASRNSEMRVYGIDLHQVKPDKMPSNVVFETVNVMTGFPFNTGTFDLVHSRLLIGGITDWNSYLENLLRITKRGGHVECIELELRPIYRGITKHESLDQWARHMADTLEASQLSPDVAGTLKQQMIDAGFSDVHDRIVETPIGDWAVEPTEKRIGAMAMTFSEQHMIQWLSSALLESGRSETEVTDLSKSVMQELSDEELQASFRWHFVTGRK